MTRKEVCKATGLSVKTLRLYEEKGLIAPEKERRNGKDYWLYTPELVAQLERIALLRRALFTMDEIRTMQEHPEEISDIVQSYQQWLRLQEQQLHRLRQAADAIQPETLSGVDSLIAQLQGAASAMPLPAMDIKPNFKRLDEMDEGPRHVELQRDLDDMVPNATVFRQVNIMVDRDRGNDANLALGQLQATVRGFRENGSSGPVRGKQTAPKWRRLLSGGLTALLPILLITACLSTGEIAIAGVLFWADLGLLALLWAIPAWMAHRNWVREAQQADYTREHARTGVDPSVYERARKKRRRLILLGICGTLILAGGIYALAQTLYAQAHPETDYKVCFVSPADIAEKDLHSMEAALSPLVGDLDGNGEAITAVDLLIVQNSLIYRTENSGDYRASDYLQKTVSGGAYTLYFMTDLLFADRWDHLDFSFRSHCRQLPADIADEEDPYRVTLHGVSMLENARLGELTVYGCISQAASEEEYAFAVELLRKILAK